VRRRDRCQRAAGAAGAPAPLPSRGAPQERHHLPAGADGQQPDPVEGTRLHLPLHPQGDDVPHRGRAPWPARAVGVAGGEDRRDLEPRAQPHPWLRWRGDRQPRAPRRGHP
ncbi:MAG: hypothetical protein AVDCRST_MAG47-2349, partial [uncultured Nocardioidaceae bacterium]